MADRKPINGAPTGCADGLPVLLGHRSKLCDTAQEHKRKVAEDKLNEEREAMQMIDWHEFVGAASTRPLAPLWPTLAELGSSGGPTKR